MRSSEKYIRTNVKVEGRGNFPLDMLRYDNCVAVNANDLLEKNPRTVQLVRFSLAGNVATVGRWASFGWTVTEDSGK